LAVVGWHLAVARCSPRLKSGVSEELWRCPLTLIGIANYCSQR
jgi:hypothetical protein